jgi:hypothetical protein
MQPSFADTRAADAAGADGVTARPAAVATQEADRFADARRHRARLVRAGTWLAQVWAAAEDRPAIAWAHLHAVPDWAMDPPSALERLTLVAGALFAAPALRVCLDPAPLLRVRALIGAAALDQVLAVPGLPPVALPWPADEGDERDTLRGWGAAMLLSSLDDAVLRASVARVLGASESTVPLLPPAAAGRLVALARRVLDAMPLARAAAPGTVDAQELAA